MKCKIYDSSSSELRVRQATGGGGGLSLESEYDLAMMVNDFLENGNSVGTDSRYSSDSDSSPSDLLHLSDKISYLKLVLNQYERDLLLVVNSLALSINERDLQAATPGMCNSSCIRYSLVKLLQLSGYDAGVRTSRWPIIGKVPGGDHEYIDVVYYNDTGDAERLIVDIDFRSHFEIARAVESYDKILNSLPVIYVGTFTKLKRYLQVMVEAARSSLKQNSMPLPPWRSFAYLQAKWQSPIPYQRKYVPDEHNFNAITPVEHRNCAGHLKTLHSLLVSEMEVERMKRPFNCDKRLKVRWRRHPTFHLGSGSWRAKLIHST